MIPINKRHQYRYSIQARIDNVDSLINTNGVNKIEVIGEPKEILESNKGAISDIQQPKRNQTGSSGLADLFEAIKCDSTSGNSGLTIRGKGHKGSSKHR